MSESPPLGGVLSWPVPLLVVLLYLATFNNYELTACVSL